jgi:hypothetical protein
MNTPDSAYVQALFEDYAVPAPIRRHCEAVATVGGFLAQQLRHVGAPVDAELVAAGCLLHDAFKAATLEVLDARPEWGYQPSERELVAWRDLRKRFATVHETVIAARILRVDFPEFAGFLARVGSIANPMYRSGRLELKLLHYADWRVQFDQVVDLEERLAYLREKYTDDRADSSAEAWATTVKAEKELEADIFAWLPFEPSALSQQVQELLIRGRLADQESGGLSRVR